MNNDGLDNNKTDIIVATLKGAAGIIPYVGGIAAELIGNLIPNQRMDRLVVYTRGINERLDALEEQAKQKLLDSEAIDIFEDGAYQAVRALSPERQEYILNLVTFGMTGEQHERLQAKRLINLLKEVDDDQIIILASYLRKNRFSDDFRLLHQSVLTPPRAHMGSTREEMDKATVFELTIKQLVTQGLLKDEARKDITTLGRLLLRRIGLAEEGEM